MQIKPLRSMVGSYGSIRRGVVANIPDHIAQQLVKRGVAVPVQGEKEKEAARSAPARPSSAEKASPNGGPTGKGKRSSSSAGDRASKANRSRKSQGGRA